MSPPKIPTIFTLVIVPISICLFLGVDELIPTTLAPHINSSSYGGYSLLMIYMFLIVHTYRVGNILYLFFLDICNVV